MSQAQLHLNGFTYQELFTTAGLAKLDSQFLSELQRHNKQLVDDLLAYRAGTRNFTALQVSELLLACAPILEQQIAQLFNIQDAVELARLQTLSQEPVFIFKQWYVAKQAKRRLSKNELLPAFSIIDKALEESLLRYGFYFEKDKELAIAQLGQMYLENPEQHAAEIEQLTQWCMQAQLDPAGIAHVQHWVSFRMPKSRDYEQLVKMTPVLDDPYLRLEGSVDEWRQRDGFHLTDERMSERQILGEIHYCVYCHKNEGDFCSKGFPVKKGQPELGLKTNPLEDVLTGCPLEEKISEMHVLKKQGLSVASLAMIMVDNPMCPATGHRICNDCMKACIYQKQDPVDIPQAETRILVDVLNLPWGVEIYDLLTRWNPLRQRQWLQKPYNGLKLLIMGMGPAGFTLAHHMLMEGFAVVGTDGLKIEPLPKVLLEQPIYSYAAIKEDLDDRVMAGFGGVAEYGITVRWDKNFLKLIYLSLARNKYFQVFGGIRFGGTLTVEDAWQLGFDHLAVAVGAGLPRELAIPGSMAPGMRQANDFLMALQLTGAAKKASLANLQVRLPAVVIGGGLTGVDTATEIQAYYIKQVEKILYRYESLTKTLGEARVRGQFNEHEFEILNEFLMHGRAAIAERKQAQAAGTQPDFIKLIRAWGGVTIAYRRSLQESPAYKRNHEEVNEAFKEGIYYAEGLEPKAVRLDKYGHATALVCRARVQNEVGEWLVTDEDYVLPAKAILVATGAQPNIAYEFEHKGTFMKANKIYNTYENRNGHLEHVTEQAHVKVPDFGPFTSYDKGKYRVTFLGDTHPVFHGSVVKAIASGKRTYPKILELFNDRLSQAGDPQEYERFAEKMQQQFSATLIDIKRHTPSVIEIKIKAPMAAKNFQPGQFYRIQNFEMLAPLVEGTRLQTEGMAMTGAYVDKTAGTVSLMVLEKGASSRLIATFKKDQPIALMGPAGVKSRIGHGETVLLIGGRLGAAHFRALGRELRAAGNRVLYIAGFQTADEVYCQDDLEAAADVIVWVTQIGAPVKTRRPQDCAATGDFMAVLMQYAQGKFAGPEGQPEIPLQQVNRALVVGTNQLVKMVQKARHTVLKDFLIQQPSFTASVYGPMQCMLKGVCAQCLQWQIDPATGKRTKAVFACSWQDQPMDIIDLDNVDERLAQNRTQEILTNLWLDHLLEKHNVERV